MRFLAVLLLICIVSPESGFAQWRAQLHIGVAGSTLRGDIESDTSPIIRLTGGGGLQYQSPTGFIFEPGVVYVTKGAALDGTIEGIEITATEEITYLEFPLLLGYRWDTGRSFSPKVLIGPAFAVKLDARIKFRAKSGGPEQQETDDSVQRNDMGIRFQLGGEKEIGGETLFAGFTGTFGLTNIRTVNPELHNRTAGFSVGIIF